VRKRVVLVLLAAILILVAFQALSSISNTLNRLNVAEAERDRWQRPDDVLRSLGVREGSQVVDLGSGAGYFTLKLAPLAGTRGRVVAVDLRRLSLFFLRLRTFLRGQHNVEIIVGTSRDPHLLAGRADAVLIANTYHEFDDRLLMLDHAFRALRSGGRLVIVDRGPRVTSEGTGHELPPGQVEAELRQRGFELIDRNDRFIDRPEDEPWWLIVARTP